MYARYLFLISALLVPNTICECDKYINCFGDFLRDFFENINFGDHSNSTKINTTEIFDAGEKDVGQIIRDISSLLKEIDVNIQERDILKLDNDKTKIVVKTFELDDAFNNEFTTEELTTTTESATTDISFNDVLGLHDITTPSDILSTTSDITTLNSLSVIPLKSDKENEIFPDLDAYDDLDDDKNITDYPNIDYIDIYKDTTNEDVEYIPTEKPITTESNFLREEINKQENEIENIIKQSKYLLEVDALSNLIENVTNQNLKTNDQQLIGEVFPWVAAIFVKNESKGSQFDYFCDGALLSDRVILTAARCVQNGNETFKEESFIVILGKKSLQISGGEEKILRVKKVKTHQNFTLENGNAANDLAVIILEEPVIFTNAISPAALESVEESSDEEEKSKEGIATAWRLSGDLTLIYFDKEKTKACRTDNKVENTFCATYGDDVPLCPSYGGLYITKQGEKLYLHGIRTGDPLDRGLCFSKQVTYTSLQNYTDWVTDVVKNKDV